MLREYLKLMAYARPSVGRLVLALLAAAAVSGLTALAAYLVKDILDGVFIQRDRSLLVLLPAAILAIYLLKGVFAYVHAYLMSYVGAAVVRDTRDRMYARLVLLPIGHFSRHSSGTMISRVMNDVSQIGRAFSVSLKDLLQESLMIAALAGVAFYHDWVLALLGIVVLPFAMVPIVRLGRKLRWLSRKGQEKVAGLTERLSETITGIRVVKGFGTEEAESRRFEAENRGYFGVHMRGVRTLEITTPLMEFAGAVGVAAVIWFGGGRVIEGSMTPGTFFSFLAALLLLYTPAKRLSRVRNELQQTMGAAERVIEFLETPAEIYRPAGSREASPLARSIVFENVSFRYEGRKRDALEDVSLEVRAGEVIALVGASGGGKTTLVNLLPRFYDPTSGRILMDGTGLGSFDLSSLRRQIGIVAQDVILFDATIGENIAYGSPGASKEAIEAAARAAHAEPFILDLPDQYGTRVGERGLRLSGGQRQRIAIARALLRNPSILILDEATSSLDSESERLVQEALAALMRARTTFVIAHRLSTVVGADRILVIEKGRIVEEGTHLDLMARGGAYQRYYNLQFKDAETVAG